MITTLVLVIHVIVCIALILIILLQTGKGADIGAAFGGGSSQTVFGSGGATTFLSKITIAAAVVFMITSIILTYFSDKGFATREKSIVTERSVPGAGTPVPVEQSGQDSGVPGKEVQPTGQSRGVGEGTTGGTTGGEAQPAKE